MDDRKEPEKGEVAGSPALPFENFELQLEADASPFKHRPQPIGGSRRGIPNKRTTQLRELYLKMGLPHPVLAMGQLLRLGVDGLARELQCTMAEAGEFYRKVAADLSPYIEGKQPTKVELEGNAGLPLIILGDRAVAREVAAEARAAGSLAIDDEVEPALIEYEQNQELKRAEAEKSQGDPSHDEAKALNTQAKPSSDR